MPSIKARSILDFGKTQDDSLALARVRRFLTSLIPQSFSGTFSGAPVLTFTQRFSPFSQRIDLDFPVDRDGRLDHQPDIAASVPLCSIEGRQSWG
jgi:hypothetical protein